MRFIRFSNNIFFDKMKEINYMLNDIEKSPFNCVSSLIL